MQSALLSLVQGARGSPRFAGRIVKAAMTAASKDLPDAYDLARQRPT